MPHRDIIVIGASAGGVEALQELVAGLPGDLPAAMFVVLHMAAHSPGILADILDRAGPLPCAIPYDGEPVQRGRVYVARPDHHLLLKPELVRVVQGPKENRSRPAIDPLFRSASVAYGQRVIGVLLTGLLDDGTAGLYAIKQQGGLTVVQDPLDALFGDMPRNAIQKVAVDYVLGLADIPTILVRLTEEELDIEEYAVPERLVLETEIAEGVMENSASVGTPSVFSCPECGGVLQEIREGEPLRFRCQVGHAYTAKALADGQTDRLEDALWSALRMLEERAHLDRRIAEDARRRAINEIIGHFEARALEAERNAEVIREALMSDNGFLKDRRQEE